MLESVPKLHCPNWPLIWAKNIFVASNSVSKIENRYVNLFYPQCKFYLKFVVTFLNEYNHTYTSVIR